MCVRVPAPLVPRHSWLGCATWVCVFGLGFRLHPASPSWGVAVCVCSCARSACSPPLLAGLSGVCVCVRARVLAAPRHSWLGCWGVSVFVCLLCLYPATPGCRVRPGCVCLGSGFGCPPAALGWGVGLCVRLCARSACTSTLLAGSLGCVCVRVPRPLVPRHSPLGCAAWACVFGLGFRLRPAALGWVVGVCVCQCARSACTPPLLAGVGAVGVCAWARVSPVPRHSWLGCWGVCVFVCSLCLYPATPGWGLRRGFVGWVLPRTCSCAVVCCVLCALPGFAAPGGRCRLAPVQVPWFWLAACLSRVPLGPALVRRAWSGPVALGAPVGFPDAVVPFPIPGACAPGFTGRLCGARGGCAVWCQFVCLWLSVVLVCGAVGAAVCGALCVLPGAVWRACAWLGFRTLLSGAVLRLVLLGCFSFVLLSRAVFSAGFFFALFRASPWWSFLFWSVWCSAVVCPAV